MKLTMFDTTDPTDVTVAFAQTRHELFQCSYNHKAIMISPDKSIIAFPPTTVMTLRILRRQGFYKRAVCLRRSGDAAACI